jgi:hypothetical protein
VGGAACEPALTHFFGLGAGKLAGDFLRCHVISAHGVPIWNVERFKDSESRPARIDAAAVMSAGRPTRSAPRWVGTVQQDQQG